MTLITILLLAACGDKDPGESIEPGECTVDTGGAPTDTGGEADTGEDGGSGGEDSGDGTDTGEPPDTEIDTSHCDATGYLPWLEALVAEYEETGRCPEIPTEVPMLDGTMYSTEVEEYHLSGFHGAGEFINNPHYPQWTVSVDTSSHSLCADAGGDVLEGGDWVFSARASVYDDGLPGELMEALPTTRPFFGTPLWLSEYGEFVLAYLWVWMDRYLSDDRILSTYAGSGDAAGSESSGTLVPRCGYSLVCLEDYGSTPGPYFETEGETPGGHASGWIYVHTEQWWDTTERPYRPSAESGPMDLIVHLDGELDCTTFAEDTAVSGWKLDPDDYPWPNWNGFCDGVDNDYDGEIDEGRDLRPRRNLDRDDNGIPDCQQDCDGDGIPNYDDLDDLDECTPTGL